MKKITLLVLLSACTQVSTEALKLQEADEQMIAGCKFLGSAHETADGGMFQDIGLNRAKNYFIQAAYEKGGTHYVITNTNTGRPQSVSGKVYQCQK